jgi:hypothetical protein
MIERLEPRQGKQGMTMSTLRRPKGCWFPQLLQPGGTLADSGNSHTYKMFQESMALPTYAVSYRMLPWIWVDTSVAFRGGFL